MLEYQVYLLFVLGAIISIVCLVLYKKSASSLSKLVGWSVVLVIFVWPASFLSVSTHNIEKSQALEFCASCHQMDLHVADVRKTSKQSLAAKHHTRSWVNQNPCYTCHTNYTMFGTAEAKFKGMKHMYAVLFHSVDEKKIKIYDPYPDHNCMQCHDNYRFEKPEEHKDIMADERCVDCHDDAHFVREEADAEEPDEDGEDSE